MKDDLIDRLRDCDSLVDTDPIALRNLAYEAAAALERLITSSRPFALDTADQIWESGHNAAVRAISRAGIEVYPGYNVSLEKNPYRA